MIRHSAQNWLHALLLWVLAQGVAGAVELQPPLLAMHDPNLGLLAGTIVSVQQQPPSILFEVTEALRGEASGQIRLLVDGPLLDQLAPGEGFLALYSDLVAAPMKVRVTVHAPERSRLLAFEGVQLSLFRDSPQMRGLLQDDPIARAASADYRSQVFAGLALNDPQLADLWAGELTVRAQRLSPYSAGEIAQIESFVLSGRHPAAARARLLQLASDRQPLLGSDWYAAAAAKVIASTPVFSKPEFGVDTLIYSALQILAAHPNAVAAEVVEPWLASTPIVAEAAALVLRAQSPQAERAALDRALGRAMLPAVTRTFIQQHRQRLPALPTGDVSESAQRR